MRGFRTVALVALAAVFVGIFGATAFAGEADVAGEGWLAARGKGSVTVDMGGTMRMRIDGDVVIRDVAGDMSVEIDGAAPPARGTVIRLEDFDGKVVVTGTHFVLRAEGTGAFVAKGHGFASLDGRGVYKTRDGAIHPWGGRVDLGS